MKLSLGSHGLVEIHVVVSIAYIRVSITRSRVYSERAKKQFKFPNTLHHLQKIKKLCQLISGQDEPTTKTDWKEYDGFSTFQEVEFNSGKQVSWFAYRIFIPASQFKTAPFDVYYY